MEYFQISSCPAGLCKTASNPILVVLIWNLVIPRSVGECQHLDISILKLLDRPQPRYARSKISVFHWIICRRKLENNKKVKQTSTYINYAQTTSVSCFSPLFRLRCAPFPTTSFPFVLGPRGCDLLLPSWSTFICNNNRLGATAASSPPSSKVVARRDLRGVISDKLQTWIHHSIRSFQQPPLKQKNKSKKRKTNKKKTIVNLKFGVHVYNPPEKPTYIEPEKDEFQESPEFTWIPRDPPFSPFPSYHRHLGSTASTKWNPYLGWFRWNVGECHGNIPSNSYF